MKNTLKREENLFWLQDGISLIMIILLSPGGKVLVEEE